MGENSGDPAGGNGGGPSTANGNAKVDDKSGGWRRIFSWIKAFFSWMNSHKAVLAGIGGWLIATAIAAIGLAISIEAQEKADSAQSHASNLEVSQYADAVSLAEGPGSVYPTTVGQCDVDYFKPPGKPPPVLVVANSSDGPITDTWVKTVDKRKIYVGTVSPHWLAALLPPGVPAKTVHFTDAKGVKWTRDREGPAHKGDVESAPISGDRETSAMHRPISEDLPEQCHQMRNRSVNVTAPPS